MKVAIALQEGKVQRHQRILSSRGVNAAIGSFKHVCKFTLWCEPYAAQDTMDCQNKAKVMLYADWAAAGAANLSIVGCMHAPSLCFKSAVLMHLKHSMGASLVECCVTSKDLRDSKLRRHETLYCRILEWRLPL